jgi:hypothetical protein
MRYKSVAVLEPMLEKLEYALIVTAMATLCAATQGQSASSKLNHASTSQSQSIPSADGHHIYVLLLSGKSDKPVADVWVLLKGVGENGKIIRPQSVRSNSQGIAEFSLADPMPERVGLDFGTEFASCSDVQFLTDQILKSGVIAKNTCSDEKVYSSHSPVAGQLVVFGRRITLWERIRQELP